MATIPTCTGQRQGETKSFETSRNKFDCSDRGLREPLDCQHIIYVGMCYVNKEQKRGDNWWDQMGGGYVETPLIYLTKHLCTSTQQDAE
jgi:hypothetical protein